MTIDNKFQRNNNFFKYKCVPNIAWNVSIISQILVAIYLYKKVIHLVEIQI